MVSLANYKYTSNAGTVYQVTVPDDFATALGMTLASGSEPYLSSAISPRYANYRSLTLGTRSAIVQDTTTFASLPSTLTVGGAAYTFSSAVGESIPISTGPLLMAPQGPQGPQGATGAAGTGLPLSYTNAGINADVTMTSATTWYTAATITVTAATWLVFGRITFLNAGTITMRIRDNSSVIYASASQLQATASAYQAMSLFAVVVAGSGLTLTLEAQSNVAGDIIKHSDALGDGNASGFLAIKTG